MAKSAKINKNVTKRRNFLMALIPIGVLLFIVLFHVVIVVRNNIDCKNNQKNLADTVTKQGYEILDSGYECFPFNDDSNGINYLNTVIIKTDISKADIQNSFSSYNIIVRNIEQTYFSFSDNESSIKYKKLEGVEDLSEYYVIYSINLPSSELLYEFDVRGN